LNYPEDTNTAQKIRKNSAELFGLLKTRSESDVQKILTELVKSNVFGLSGVNTNSVTYGAPLLNCPNTPFAHSFQFSGKPDMLSTEFPMFLEIKDSNASTKSKPETLQPILTEIEITA
jgi:hypothetical protein